MSLNEYFINIFKNYFYFAIFFNFLYEIFKKLIKIDIEISKNKKVTK